MHLCVQDAIPALYIQDPTSGIRYELDEDGLANDVHPGQSDFAGTWRPLIRSRSILMRALRRSRSKLIEIGNKVAAHGVDPKDAR